MYGAHSGGGNGKRVMAERKAAESATVAGWLAWLVWLACLASEP